jgi:chaperonin GroEL (HSP60 family)
MTSAHNELWTTGAGSTHELAASGNARGRIIQVGTALADTLRPTLGPCGLNKMLVRKSGTVIITSDGKSILEEMATEHPVARMIIAVARAQNVEVGDGTTRTVLLAGELLSKASELLDIGLQPAIVVNGYRRAAAEAVAYLRNEAQSIDIDDDEQLTHLAMTSLSGSGFDSHCRALAALVVDAMRLVQSRPDWDVDHVRFVPIPGGTLSDSSVVDGIVLDKRRPVSNRMPESLRDAILVTTDGVLASPKTSIQIEARISDVERYKTFQSQEESSRDRIVTSLVNADVDAIFVGNKTNIDERIQGALAEHRITAFHQIDNNDLFDLARATGATVTSKVESITSEHTGFARSIETRDIGSERKLFVEGVESPGSVSVLVRGGTEHVVQSAKEALERALRFTRFAYSDSLVCPAAGAPWIRVAGHLRERADQHVVREQFAIKLFA